MTAAKSAPGQGPKLTVVDNAHAVSPGQRLARARAQRNLTLEDVAKQLNLSVSMVRAMESDNFKSLPGHAFVKGYLRNYGKMVGLAPDELVKAYESLRGDAQEASLSNETRAMPRSTRWVAHLIKGVAYVVVLAVLAGIIGVVYQNFGFLADKTLQLVASLRGENSADPVISEIVAPVVSSETGSDDQTIRLSIPLHPIEPSVGVENESTAPADAPAAVDATQPAVTVDAPVSAPVSTETEPVVAPVMPPQSSLNTGVAESTVANSQPQQTQVPSVEAPSRATEIRGSDGAASVSLNFSGKSWVGVTDARGRSVFNGTRNSGVVEQVQGKPPLKIIIGNAPVVKVSFNGKPFDFDFSSRSNVAQFTLGDD